MSDSLHDLLLGERFDRNLDLLSAAVLFLGTFIAYAIGLFTVEGGVIFLPADATFVGIVVAAGIGYRRSGLLGAWLAQFATYLGFHAEWAFLGLSSHGLAGKLSFMFDPTSLAIFAMAAVSLGTAVFALGYLLQWCVERAGLNIIES